MSRTPVSLLNVRIDDISLSDAIRRTEEFLQQDAFHHVVTPGPEFLLEASAHPEFRDILNRSDLSLPDGFGLKVAAPIARKRIHNRVSGVDYVNALMALAAQHGYRVYLYGGSPGAAEQTAQKLLDTFPGLAVVGFESGHRGWWQRLHHGRVIEKIHRAKPDILLVALGAPKQEFWIEKHRDDLHDVRVAVGVGRTFEYLSGKIRRPPRLLRKLGLEWLYTYVFASRFHHPEHRRQRVKNATWRFLHHTWKHRHEP